MLIIVSGILFFIYGLKQEKICGKAFADSVWFMVLFAYIVTEICSLGHMINRAVIVGSWTCLILLLLILLVVNRKKNAGIIKIESNRENRGIQLFLGIICVGMLILSAVSITSNWDSMTYHMPRVMHWIQNQSVDFYATSEVRQITSPPLAEYMIMHVMLLSGSDKFVCMVHGMSYVLSAGLIYFISIKMNVEKRYAYLAVFLFLMMPPAIAEAVTTQNDLFAAMIMLLFFYYYLDFIYKSDLTISKEILILSVKLGTTIALGYLAKPNVLIIMAILIGYLGIIKIWNKEKVKNMLFTGVAGIVTAVIGICPFMIKSYKVYGKLFPSSQTEGITVATLDVRLLIANCYKNLVKYISTPLIPGINNFLMKVSYVIERVFRIDINDPAISTMEFTLPDGDKAYQQSMAANPVVMLLCFLVILGIIFKKCEKLKLEIGMFFCTILGLLSTCAISKWSPWKVRYFLPFSVVAIIFVCLFIGQIKNKYKWKDAFVGFIICLGLLSGYGALHYTANEVKMQYEGDEDGQYSYFANRHVRGAYNDIEAYVEKMDYKQVGLYLGGDRYEYPLWLYLDQTERIEHVMVKDEYLQKLEDPDFLPECIVSIGRGDCELGQVMEYHGIIYRCQYLSPHGYEYAIFDADEMQ